MDIRESVTKGVLKKIFGSAAQAKVFLTELQKVKGFSLPTRTITKGVNKGQVKIDIADADVWSKILEHWDYDNSRKIIRRLFKNTKKYTSGQESHSTMNVLLDEWRRIQLGVIAWPFSQGDFDGFVQRVNSELTDDVSKDEKVKLAAVKYRRIKEINTVRNDFIETLIFEKNESIIPTLNHNRAADFFIGGISYDQKVAKSPTNEFKKDFGVNWRDFAINQPEKVAEYLYRYQDEGRFGADKRLLVVYLDEDVTIDRIAEIIDETNLDLALEVEFEYRHKSTEATTYCVECFIILLFNR